MSSRQTQFMMRWTAHLPGAAVPLLVLGISFSIFAAVTPDALTEGDAALYAQQIKHSNFSERTVHLGYLLIGRLLCLFDTDFSDRSLNLLSCFFAAATLTLVFLMSSDLLKSRAAALFAVATLFTNYLFVSHAIYAEVYISQAFFLVVALYLWSKQHPVTTGISLAISTLISPSTLLAAPSLLILRPRPKPCIRMALTAGLILTLALSPVLADFLFSSRGLLKAIPSGIARPSAAGSSSIFPFAAVLKEGFEVVVGFFTLLPILALGAIELVRRKPCRRVGLAIASLWFFAFVFGATHPTVPVQLPTYILLAVVTGMGYQRAQDLVDQPKATSIQSIARWCWLPIFAGLPILLLSLAMPFAGSLASLPPTLPSIFALCVVATAALATAVASQKSMQVGLTTMLWALVSLNAALVFLLVQHENREAIIYRNTAIEVGNVAEPDFLVIGTWGKGILFNHYVYGESYTDRWLAPEWLTGYWGSHKRDESQRVWKQALHQGRQIWLLGPYPSLFSDLQDYGYVVSPFRSLYRADSIQRSSGEAAANRAPGDAPENSPVLTTEPDQ